MTTESTYAGQPVCLVTAPQRSNKLSAIFSKIKKQSLLCLLFVPAFLLMAGRTSAQGVSMTVDNGVLNNAFYTHFYSLTFTTAQTGLSASNFTLTGSVPASITGVSGSGTSWKVTVTINNSFHSEGVLTLNMVNNTGLSPGVSGLPVAGPTIEAILYPVTGTFSLSSENANSGYAKVGDKLDWTLNGVNYIPENWGVTVGGSLSASGFGNFSNINLTGSFTANSSIPQGAIAYSWNYTNAYNESTSGSGTSSIIFDSVNPTISIGQPSSSTASTGPVSYTVTYADANFNASTLSASNITLNKTGTANGTVGVTEISSTLYAVTISNISGSGTLGISIAAGTASDKAGNLAPASSPSTTFNVVPSTPTTTSISSNNNPSFSTSPGNSVIFTATVTSFATPVTEGTVTFTSNGTTIGGPSALNGSGQATVNTNFTTTGPYTVQAIYSGSVDFSSSSGSLTQQVNLQPIAINSITANNAYSNSGAIQFTVNFGASVTGLSTSNFSLTTTGSVSGALIASVSPSSGSTYTVTVNTGTGDGTIGLNLDNATGLTPGISTRLPFTGATTTIEKTPPSVTSLNPTTPSNSGPTNSSTLTYTITFSVPVTGLNAGDFNVNTDGTATYTGLSVTTVTGNQYTITITGVGGNGDLNLVFESAPGDVFDLAGNAVSNMFAGGSYTIDTSPPQLRSVVFSNPGNPFGFSAQANVGAVLTLNIGFTEQIQTPVITIGGHSVTPTFISSDGGIWVWGATYTLTSSDTEGQIAFDVVATDLAGNATEVSSNSTGAVVNFDKTPPTINVSNPSVSSIVTGTGSVTYTVTYADANFDESTLSTGDITLNTTGTATGTVALSGSGTSYTVTISNINGNGTLGISIGSGTASDLAGNLAPASGASPAFNVIINEGGLKLITLSTHTALTQTTGSAQVNLATSVSGSITSLTVTPTADYAGSTITINGITVASGTPSGSITLPTNPTIINLQVTGQNGTIETYSVSVGKSGSNDANLKSLILSSNTALVTQSSTTSAVSFTTSVSASTTSLTVIPTTDDPNATVTVNGTGVTSGSPSGTITLSTNPTVINVLVTAQDGTTTRSYAISVSQAGSNDANLKSLILSSNTALVTQSSTTSAVSFTTSVSPGTTSLTVTPTTDDPNATVMVNGIGVTSGNPSGTIMLSTNPTIINVLVTAQDGTTTRSYAISVSKAGSSDAGLKNLQIAPYSLLTRVADINGVHFTGTVSSGTASLTVTPTTDDPNATATVNSAGVSSGTASSPITINVGTTTITLVVTAQDGITSRTFPIIITRPESAMNSFYEPISVTKPADSVTMQNDGIVVHQAVSPNGDGINDFLAIDGITNYPDNHLTIINRNGALVYETRGYDNSTRLFDGHSSTNGQMQLPGTYFYSLDYVNAKGETKHQTGFIILKY